MTNQEIEDLIKIIKSGNSTKEQRDQLLKILEENIDGAITILNKTKK